MTDRIVCLDTSVYIQYFAAEEHVQAAKRVLLAALDRSSRLVAPAWAWAEVGSVLRKKVRAGLVEEREARSLWQFFLRLSIDYIDGEQLQHRSWEIAEQLRLPSLYDATFLACTELAEPNTAPREFWTADEAFVRALGNAVPDFVRLLTG